MVKNANKCELKQGIAMLILQHISPSYLIRQIVNTRTETISRFAQEKHHRWYSKSSAPPTLAQAT